MLRIQACHKAFLFLFNYLFEDYTTISGVLTLNQPQMIYQLYNFDFIRYC